MENIATKKPTKISFKQLFDFASQLPRVPHYEQQGKTYQFAVINENECSWKIFPDELITPDIRTVNVRYNPRIMDWELMF